jgi:hypothetical protein
VRSGADAPGDQGLAEADGEAQHLDAAPAGDAVVPEFMDEHEQGQREQEGQQRRHWVNLSSCCVASRRDRWSRSMASSSEPGASARGIASSTAWLITQYR